MKLWIDDIRPAPDDSWIWRKTVYGAWFEISNEEVSYYNYEECVISLDHDAGDEARFGGDYIMILNKLEENYHSYDDWKYWIDNYVKFKIHSMNIVGVENMRRIIRKNGWREA